MSLTDRQLDSECIFTVEEINHGKFGSNYNIGAYFFQEC